LALTYRERHAMTDVSIRLQGSDTLQNWITYNTLTEADRETFTGYDEVTLLDPQAFTNSRRFLRLRLELTPVPVVRAPTQLTLEVVTPTTWSATWTDPNTTETGYAVERLPLSTGQWERLTTLGADLGTWAHTAANYQTSMTYRVVALGADNTEAASAPITLPDTEGDGLPDALELGSSFLGVVGTYASDPNQFSSNNSAISDGWLAANGFNPAAPFNGDADSDGDGLTDAEEARRGTDPHDMDGDTDNDGILDPVDGWPRTPWLSPPILPEVRYAVIPLRSAGLSSQVEPFSVDDQNRVFGSQYTGYDTNYFSPVYDIYKWQNGQVTLWAESYSANTNTTYTIDSIPLKTGQIGNLLKSPNYDYDTIISISSNGTGFDTQRTGYYVGRNLDGGFYYYNYSWDISLSPNGIFKHRADGTTTVLWSIINYFFNENVGTTTILDTPIDGGAFLPFMAISDDLMLGGWGLNGEPTNLFNYGGGYYPAINENGVVTKFPYEDKYRLDYVKSGAVPADTLNHIPNLFYIPSQNNLASAWIHKDQANQIWKQEPMTAWDTKAQCLKNIQDFIYINNRLEIIHGSKITRNGQTQNLNNFIDSSWTQVYAQDLNNHGVILATATRTLDAQGQSIPLAAQVTEPVLLLPANFIVPNDFSNPNRKSLGAFTDTTAGPRVTLEEITLSNVSVSNGVASVTISGELIDAPMGTIPPGQGGDITEVVVFINGQETHLRGTVTRANQAATFWAPYVDKGIIAPITITFPARDVATIEIQTAPNALGLTGRAGFEVVFAETTPAPGQIPGVSYSADLVFPASLSTTAADTILLTEPDAPTGKTLQETGPATGIFVNALKTASFTLHQSGLEQSGAPVAPIKGRLSGLTDQPVGTGFGQGQDEGQETAPGSLRHRFTITREARPLPRNPSWQLHEVAMLSAQSGSPARPIGFASAPLESLKLGLLDQDFALEKITGHPDQNTAFAVTATGKPLLGFVAVREEDPEAETPTFVREFVYYDHTAQALTRRALIYEAGHAAWALKFGPSATPTTIEQKTLAKTIRMVDATGAERPGFLPVDYENLQAFLDGEDGVAIAEDATFHLELTGHVPGEVVRVFSTEATDDYFDLVIPGADPLLVPHEEKNTLLTEVSGGVYRTTEKMVVYSTPGDPSLRLNDADWRQLKAMGYVTLHNNDFVVNNADDLARYTLENNITNLHPDATAVLGISGRPGIKNATFYKFDGFADHHVFNAYHENEVKAARWNKIFNKGWKRIFGDDFDVDEFTVPLNKKVHGKITHLITKRWEDFMDEFFDSAGELKAGVDLKILRANTINKMYLICDEFNIDTSRMRIWPQVARNRNAQDTLYQRLLASEGRMGSSLNKLTQIKKTAYQFASIAAKQQAARQAAKEVKEISKRLGKRNAARLVPFVSLALTTATITSAAIDVNQLGWEEATAQAINEQTGLDDLELCREFVSVQFANTIISGGTPKISVKINSTQYISLGDRSFKLSHNGNVVTGVYVYSVVEIKAFPDGKIKVAFVREDYPNEKWVVENLDYAILDYFPELDSPLDEFKAAEKRAIALRGF
jgi:Bacterial TSP3 repeat